MQVCPPARSQASGGEAGTGFPQLRVRLIDPARLAN